jgi:4-amino-4-deoxy-L-arabinose transferase-like glycosyltransferase
VVLPAARRLVGSAYRRLGPAPVCSRRDRRWLLTIVLVAIGLRLAWVVYAAREPRGFHDPTLYEVFSMRIADGHGYTDATGHATTYYPVGYVAALGALLWLVRVTPIPDDLPTAAAVFNLLLGVAAVALTFEVGRRLVDNKVGLVAAAIVALWPNLIFHTTVLLTETLFIALVLAAVLVLVALPADASRIGWRRLSAFGVILALSALVRPISLVFLPALFVVVVAGFGWTAALRYTGIAALALVVVLAPWTVRNIRATHSFVPISTNLGDNLCMSRHAGATGGYQSGSACIVRARGLKTPQYEVEVNNTNIRRAVRFVEDHPLTEAKLVFLRAYHTVENDHDGLLASESYGSDRFVPSAWRHLLEIVADAYFFVASALAVVAVPMYVRRVHPWRRFLLLAAAVLSVQPLIFFGDPRFHVPVLPFAAVLAATAICRAPALAAAGSAHRRVLPARHDE